MGAEQQIDIHTWRIDLSYSRSVVSNPLSLKLFGTGNMEKAGGSPKSTESKFKCTWTRKSHAGDAYGGGQA
jgi:hypothetical protein